MKILSLDISSNTGWSILDENCNIEEYGTMIELSNDDNSFPWGIYAWSKRIALKLDEMISKVAPDVIVIERTTAGSWRNSQNLLDFIHALFLDLAIQKQYNHKIVYLDVSAWRKTLNLRLNTEQKKLNRLAKQASNQGKIFKVNGKRVGKTTKKHLAVNYINERFDLKLKLKDNNVADSLCLAVAYLTTNPPNRHLTPE